MIFAKILCKSCTCRVVNIPIEYPLTLTAETSFLSQYTGIMASAMLAPLSYLGKHSKLGERLVFQIFPCVLLYDLDFASNEIKANIKHAFIWIAHHTNKSRPADL